MKTAMMTAMKIRPASATIAQLATAMVLASALGLCLVGCSSRQARTVPPAIGKNGFTSVKDGFSITGPEVWEMAEGKMGAAVMFLEPPAGASDNFRENVNVVVETLSSGMKLDGYAKASHEAMAKMMTNFKEISSSRVKLGQNDARRGVFQHTMGVYNLKVLSYLVVSGGRGYVLTCTAAVDEYDSHEQIFEDICQTFQTQ